MSIHFQVLIERRYDRDDPGIEQKLRETNEDCIRSKSMELETEQFLTHYPINLLKFGRDTEDDDETRLIVGKGSSSYGRKTCQHFLQIDAQASGRTFLCYARGDAGREIKCCATS
jgi:hypothetical protein